MMHCIYLLVIFKGGNLLCALYGGSKQDLICKLSQTCVCAGFLDTTGLREGSWVWICKVGQGSMLSVLCLPALAMQESFV